MAASPEANSTQVPGSGTTPVTPDPQAPAFFFFPPTSPSPISPEPFFFTGSQRPVGNGGGASGTQFPATNGSYKLSRPAGPRPGISGRLSNADSKATGGDCVAVPFPA